MASTEDDAIAFVSRSPALRTSATRLLESRRLTIGVFLAALLLLAAIAAASYISVLVTAEHNRWVDHTYQVILSTDKLLLDQQEGAANQRGYLLTGSPEFLDRYRLARDKIAGDIQVLADLTADNPVQQARMGTLRTLSLERLQHLDQLVGKDASGRSVLDVDGITEVESSRKAMDAIRVLIGAVIQEERNLLAERSDQVESSRRWVLLIIVAGNVLSLGALLACLLLLNRQIRDRRAAEIEVRSLNETLTDRARQLELANGELEGFSYSISHDLRSPLRAIDGFSQLLQKRFEPVLDAEGMRLLGVVRDSSKRMGALIEDLLEFSRLGRKPLDSTLVEMGPLARECLAEALEQADPKPHVTVNRLPACWGDRALLKQVWANLIGNAVKYSSHTAAPRIEISGSEEGDRCVYTVSDNGAGFDMQYYAKLFGVFQRLHGMDEFSGTGVGLAIVMRIVTKHSGRVWAEAELNKGATFHFSIPREEAQA
jgi:signal transduction histidine kinase